ncbi:MULTISPECIES: sigma-54 dependent transcriptional regulator [Desulfobacter]|jgi:NtrC-family two-component system response regulator AlgB|uniref:sigma-54-dependent transcriptional regulator n=2 Tax=Desulfobacteraceae TaxID=213119 RepID=UPI000E8F9212|nr:MULTISPECIES: sigma-54 dependent transcriptional regulator [Desulfobacter]MDX9962930.1 sigma-54 dependent transcriptional regulator [Desulfobacter postgatei]HBT87970.1 sigma-54-dependent Fis family transcriptional regulator [Desulfobacter sp.]
MNKVLIIDDDSNIMTTLEIYFEENNFKVFSAETAEKGLACAKSQLPDLILLDLKLPDKNGLDVLQEIIESGIKTQVLMITAYASIETAVSAVKMGAFDYLPKPFVPGQLDLVLEKIKRFSQMENEIASLKGLFSEGGFITRNSRLLKILKTAGQASDSDATILIGGESGTGKSLLARLIHDWSPRSEKPFVVVDCAAFQENLLESDLFGHVKGAFTGAVKDKLGKLKLADGGTVFLDEVSEIPKSIQGKLLRFIQEHKYECIGDPEPRSVNVRIIAATNRDLEAMVEDGVFRKDLYFRLNVMELFLPPLRERPEDIKLLSEMLLKKSSRVNGKTIRSMDQSALERLQAYPWPGNVRELANTIERAVITATGKVLIDKDLSPGILNYNPDQNTHEGLECLDEIEKQHIRKVIMNTVSLDEAAKILGIDPATLWRKRKKYQLD